MKLTHLFYFSDLKSEFYKVAKKEEHPYHIVAPSFIPVITAISTFCLVTGISLFFHDYIHIKKLIILVVNLFVSISLWGGLVSEEGLLGFHTRRVLKGLQLGFLLFIASEVMFFFSFFWAFFHYSLSPSIWICCVWPPPGIPHVNYFSIPLLNTFLLVSSGFAVTFSHRAAKVSKNSKIARGLMLSVFYGILFISCQYYEYNTLSFNISNSVYGSIFYTLTGFHGTHVIIGLIMLFHCLVRVYSGTFTKQNHLGLEAAIYYWHFVDVVWLFVYFFIYIWGSS